MSRVGVFRSHNKVGETWSFNTIAWSGVSFSSTIAFEGGISRRPTTPGHFGGNPHKRISWDYGVVYGANNATPANTNPTGGYHAALKKWMSFETPTSFPDFQNSRTVTIRTNRLNDVKYINFQGWTDGHTCPYGHIDLSEFTGLESLIIHKTNNMFLSGITFPSTYRADRSLSNFIVQSHQTEIEDNWHLGGTGLKGELDLSGVRLGGGSGFTDQHEGYFSLTKQAFLNSVKHGPSDEKFYRYQITPSLDPYAYTQWIPSQTYRWHNPVSHGDGYSGITGTHDMRMLTGLGGLFDMGANPYLEEIFFPVSNNRFTLLNLENCDLKGHLDLSGIDIGNLVEDDYNPTAEYGNKAGFFSVQYQGAHGWPVQYSYALTGITHGPNTSNINTYWCSHNGFTTLDLSMLKIGTPVNKLNDSSYNGNFWASGCKYLTGITHTYTDLYIKDYRINSCSELLEHDMTMIPNLCGYFTAASCGKLKKLSHTTCTSTYPLTTYHIGTTGIEDNHDMSMFPKLGGNFYAFSCYSLTGLTFTTTSESFSRFHVYQSSLKGELDLTNLTGLGGEFRVEYNKGDYYHTKPSWPNPRPVGLTKITHTASTVNFSKYHAYNCALEGELDVSMLENLGGNFNVSYNYSGFTNYYGNLQNIKFPSNNRSITISAAHCNLQDNLDVTMMSGMTYLNVSHNVNLSGVTIQNDHPYPLTIHAYYRTGWATPSIPLKSWGSWDLSHVVGLTSLNVRYNTQLSGLTLPTTTNPMTLVGDNTSVGPDLDLTTCGGLKYLDFYDNPNLTGVTFTSSVEPIERLQLHNCNLTGTLDISMLTTLGVGDPNDVPNITKDGAWVSFNNNPNLTELIHPPHTNMIRNFNISNCGFSGHIDLSTYYIGVGKTGTSYEYQGEIKIETLPNLTSVDLPTIPTYLRRFTCSDTGIGHLDFTTMDVGAPQATDLSGDKNWENASIYYGFSIYNNPSLTGVTHGSYNRQINYYQLNNNDITGTLDISSLTALRWRIRVDNNPNLTDILFPTTTENLFDITTIYYNHALQLNDCSLGYVDFSPLAGATLNNGATSSTKYATIHLEDNGMSATDVNHILVDFATIATNNSPRWDNVTLIIGGSNAAPDGTSGGYDGVSAKNTLINTHQWIITTS